jgi:hypothetical protein
MVKKHLLVFLPIFQLVFLHIYMAELIWLWPNVEGLYCMNLGMNEWMDVTVLP